MLPRLAFAVNYSTDEWIFYDHKSEITQRDNHTRCIVLEGRDVQAPLGWYGCWGDTALIMPPRIAVHIMGLSNVLVRYLPVPGACASLYLCSSILLEGEPGVEILATNDPLGTCDHECGIVILCPGVAVFIYREPSCLSRRSGRQNSRLDRNAREFMITMAFRATAGGTPMISRRSRSCWPSVSLALASWPLY
jgi:hypothetical protein